MDYIKEIKEIVAEQAYEQLKHNLDKVDTKELGEAIDIVKDMSEAAYYCSVVEAMEKAEKEAKENGQTVYYTERYLPMYLDRDMRDRYINEKYDRYYDGPRYADDQRHTGDRMYHRDMPYYDFNEPVARDLREGRSPRARRMYMEGKEMHQGKEVQMQELEKYMGELSQDITEMIGDSTLEEKQMLHKKLAALTAKVEALMTKSA